MKFNYLGQIDWGGLNPGGPCEIKSPLLSGLISKHSSFILLKITGLCKSGWKQCCSHEKIYLKDNKEILDNLYHCLKKGWIEVVKTIKRDQIPLPVGYYKISISELGKIYFPAL